MIESSKLCKNPFAYNSLCWSPFKFRRENWGWNVLLRKGKYNKVIEERDVFGCFYLFVQYYFLMMLYDDFTSICGRIKFLIHLCWHAGSVYLAAYLNEITKWVFNSTTSIWYSYGTSITS